MSVDADKGAACLTGFAEGDRSLSLVEQKKKNRSVRFPSDNQLVTEYFEPANPWHDVPTTSRAQLAHEYLLSCRRHNTPPIDSVLHQIRELPESSIGGGTRAARLSLADCSLEGAAPADALEALLRMVQFHRLELDHAELDDEGAEALFDMIEYYESACVICITGPRQFGIRGWQAASRMIKKSAELTEIEVAESALEASHAPVLARALKPHTCRLRALCLQRAQLSGEALMCLVIALKTNGSVRELRLPDNSLTPHDAQQLGSLLRFNKNIQLMDLSNNLIQDMGVGHIADALVEQAAQTPPSAATSPISPQLYPIIGSESRGLAFLVLWNNQLTRNCAAQLSKALRSSHSLCVLNIGRNALGTEAVRALGAEARAGRGAGALLSLGLQGARLGPDAGPPLADLLQAPDTKLQRLDLRDNRLGAAGLQALLLALKENHTLTQMDLDEPAESTTLTAEDSEAATIARLTRDIRALCRRNEPPATEPERRVHRKISLTCHTACVLKNSPVASTRRGSRLRSPLPSPAPSPAGSPIPHHQQNVQVNRFSVSRVTPERESSTESSSPTTPTRPTYCSTPSRFRVVQVAEPPSIQVHPAHKRASRFSVTRNYDSMYNPSPRESPSASPTPPTNSPSPSVSPCPSDTSYTGCPKESMEIDRVPSAGQSATDYTDNPKESMEVRRVPVVSSVSQISSDYSSSPKASYSIEILRGIAGSKVDSSNSSLEYTESVSAPYEAPSYSSLTKTEIPTTIFNMSGMYSSIDTRTCANRDYKNTRYDPPSITTLSGALFSRSVPEMSTTTLCPSSVSNIKTGTADPKVTEARNTVSSASCFKSSPAIPITSSRSEPIFGPALLVEASVPPTAVPHSRFSISPSPVSYIYATEKIIKPHETKKVVLGSQTNIRQSNKADFTSVINEKNIESEANTKPIEDSSNRSQYKDTNVRRNIVSNENSPPVVTCDIKSLSTDILSYAGSVEKLKSTDVPAGINKDIQTKEVTTQEITEELRKHEMTKELTKQETISVETDKHDPEKKIEMVYVPTIRPDDTEPCIDVTNTPAIIKESYQSKLIGNDPIIRHYVPLPKLHNILEIRHKNVSENAAVTSDIPKVTAKDNEKSNVVSKDDFFKEIEKVPSVAKAVDFACKPEDVIFFISDEPISFSESEKDDIKSVSKTYSDVVKAESYKDKSEQLTYEQQIDEEIIKTETKLVKNSIEISDNDKVDIQVEVTVKTESVKDNAAKVHSDKDFVNLDDILIRKDDKAMKKIEAITEDLGNLIQEMKDMSSKCKKKCTVDIGSLDTNIVPGNFNRDIVLKKNKSESSLDSPDLEVSRLMNKKMVGSPFRDSSSSLEISGSSMESLNAIENLPKIVKKTLEDTELDRRKDNIVLSAESSVESTSEVTPVNQNYLNMSVSSNESVSPLFGKTKKIHGSLSSLEASVSSLDSKQDKIMVTSADSGIEHSLQNPSENKEDASSNEGTLTHNSNLRETVNRTESLQETLTSSPQRTSSLLDVPLKSKGFDRMRKISWVAPSPSFHIPRVEPEKVKDEKPSHLEKLLSLFQHPTSLFSRSQSDDERKSASNTPPRKDSSLTSSFWSWGSAIENYKEEKYDSSEATDSTLSERVQVSFVDESFSKKLDSKTPSTDTDNTLSELQSVVTDTTDVLVQKCLDLSLNTDNVNSDTIDLSKPNDLNRKEAPAVKNIGMPAEINENKVIIDEIEEVRLEPVRPRSFAAVLKASGSENSLEKQPSPDVGPLVDKLPVKVIRGIKENISPENTLTSSMTNTQALAIEMTSKNQPIVNALWEVSVPMLDKSETKIDERKSDLAPIATIEETCDIAADHFSSETIQLAFIDDAKVDIEVRSIDQTVPDNLEPLGKVIETVTKSLENVDLGKDALSYLMYESQDFEPDTEQTVATKVQEGSLAEELKEAAIKEMNDLSPELVIDEAIEVFPAKEEKPGSSPVIPDRAKIKKSNSLEDLNSCQRQEKDEKSPKTKTIAFKVPETSPRDIPERRSKLRSRTGSSPKSLPESLNKPCPLSKMDSILSKKKKRVSSLGKMARDSLLALNMSEEEIAEFRRSYKLTSVESLRSLESVSEDANSQSGTSFDSRCRACLRTSQESLMSLDSITEDCKCADREKPRSMR